MNPASLNYMHMMYLLQDHTGTHRVKEVGRAGKTETKTETETETERDRETETERQRERKTERKDRQRQTDRQTDRELRKYLGLKITVVQ